MATYLVDPKLPQMRARLAMPVARTLAAGALAVVAWRTARPDWVFDVGSACAIYACFGVLGVAMMLKRMRDTAALRIDSTFDELRATGPGKTVVIPRAEITGIIDGRASFVVSSTQPRRFISVPADVIGRDELRASILSGGVAARPARAEVQTTMKILSVQVVLIPMIVLSRTQAGHIVSALLVVAILIANFARRRRPGAGEGTAADFHAPRA